MGGVINIITNKQRQNGFHNSAQLMYGSYNTHSAEIASRWRKDNIHLNANIGYNGSDGHRDEMNFEQINGYAKLGYDFSKNWRSFIDVNLSNTKSSNPGAITMPIIDNDANITRGMTSLAIENEYNKTSGALKLYYNFGTHKINDGYTNNQSPKPYRFNSNDKMLGASIYQSYNLFNGNNTTVGLDFQRFGGKAQNTFPDESKNIELANIHLNTVAGYVNTQQTLLQNRLTLNAGIRLDNHEKNGSEWIPQFGLSYTPTISTVIKGIVSKGFRNPTIREMYMFPPQNPNLLPERLMNYEISLQQSLLENRLNMGLNLFYIKGDNMIQVAMVNGKPLNVNSGHIENKGVEISSTYQPTKELRLSANYSYLNMKNKLLATPEHKLYVSGTFTKNKWNLSTGVQYIGNLYKTVNPEPVKENFVLWNARVNYRVLNWMNLFVKGENLLAQEYEINSGYPMPRATVFGGIRLHI